LGLKIIHLAVEEINHTLLGFILQQMNSVLHKQERMDHLLFICKLVQVDMNKENINLINDTISEDLNYCF
jgi:hypothetical protein